MTESKLASRNNIHVQRALKHPCPFCHAHPGDTCTNAHGRPMRRRLIHYARIETPT